MASDPIDDVGKAILSAARASTPLELIEANLDRLSRQLANGLPDDVSFFLVLSKKNDTDCNMFASDLGTPEAIEKLRKVRDQMRTGVLKGTWGRENEIIESRIVRV